MFLRKIKLSKSKKKQCDKSKPLSITLCTDSNSWLIPRIEKFAKTIAEKGHNIQVVFSVKEILIGDLAFFLSLQEIVSRDLLQRNKNNLVVHQSALPKGKGMSPLAWQIIEGKNEIPITLFEAVEALDAGQIYFQKNIHFDGTELLEELREKQADAIFRLCTKFIDSYPEIVKDAREQIGEESFYSKRTPLDSELDINKSISEQFNLLRTVDNERYPAFFTYRNCKYYLLIEKVK